MIDWLQIVNSVLKVYIAWSKEEKLYTIIVTEIMEQLDVDEIFDKTKVDKLIMSFDLLTPYLYKS